MGALTNAVVCLGTFVCLFSLVMGHGRLIEPPSRSSMWRYGFHTPPNYNDNELFCGGIMVQWQQNGGKCGVCGDPYNSPQPRENEAGGKYGNGILVRRYKPGQVITATVQLTANHKGYFEFNICPNNNPKKIVSESCLYQYPLSLADESGTRHYVQDGQLGDIFVRLKLPLGMTCSQCVFQWQYRGENNWGTCADGSQKLGCGPQETFRACADVAIDSGDSESVISINVPVQPDVPSSSLNDTRPSNVGNCQAVDSLKGIPGMDTWCKVNCARGYCPRDQCNC